MWYPLAAGDPDCSNAKDLMLSKMGNGAGSDACAMHGKEKPRDAAKQVKKGEMDDLCQGEMHCWKKGAEVTYS